MATSPKEVETLRGGPPEIPRESIIYNPATDRLGGGAFGDVFKAIVQGIKVAVKVPKKQQWASPAELKAFKDEVEILKTIFHTNVVLFLGACTTPGNVMIVLEKMLCDVERLIHKPIVQLPAELQPHLQDGLSLYRKLKIAHDTVLGVSWLHDICNIVHRDLKPANLLLDENFHVKVTDFGFSEIYRPEKRQIQMKGTALYTAPEVWRMEACSKASDVYSFGLILWELFTEEDPFASYSDVEPFYEDIIVGGLRPSIPLFVPNKRGPPEARIPFPPALSALMQACWNQDPARRPTMPRIRTILESIILETNIESPAGRTFWTNNFKTSSGEGGSLKEVISFEEFIAVLSRTVGVPVADLRPLQSLFCPGDHPEKNHCGTLVTMSQFDLCQKWFGNFFIHAEGIPVLQEMIQLQGEPWFMQDLNKDITDLWLGDREEGYFLVRLSKSTASSHPFTISKRKSGVIVHRRVQRLAYDPQAPERYSVETGIPPGYLNSSNMVHLVNHLRDMRSLTHVCPREREVRSSVYVDVSLNRAKPLPSGHS
ncbi:SHK1 protein [Pelomyxa schiedti]|nr:SHK1 protein [Pelomyxa schiedti]